MVATSGDVFTTEQERIGRKMVDDIIEEVRSARRISTRHSHKVFASADAGRAQTGRGVRNSLGRGLRASSAVAQTVLGHPAIALGVGGFVATLFSFKKMEWVIGAVIGLSISLLA